MDFRKMFAIVLLSGLSVLPACKQKSGAPGSGSGDTPFIGSPLSYYMPRYMKGTENESMVFAWDSFVNRIHQFDADSMSLVRSFHLRNAGEHQVLTGKKGLYILDITADHIDLIREDGSRQDQILSFAGTPAMAAYLPEENLFVVVDNLGSIGLLSLNDQGEVLGVWIGGSKIDQINVAMAGDILKGGLLVVSMSDHSLVVVNIKESIEMKAWQYRSTSPLTVKPEWISGLPGSESVVLIESESKIFTWDINSESIISELSLTGDSGTISVTGRFRDLTPHIYTSEYNGKIYYADSNGEIQSVIVGNSSTVPAYSVLDTERGHVTSITGNLHQGSLFAEQTVRRVRLSDNLVLGSKSSQGQAATGITGDYIFFQTASPLGYITRTGYEQGSPEEILSGYNIEFLEP